MLFRSHASIVVNMDLPWNPAVLEQRIGRVHRLGSEEKLAQDWNRPEEDEAWAHIEPVR